MVWDGIRLSASSVQLTYASPDGEQGFPGNLVLEVVYTVTEDNELQLESGDVILQIGGTEVNSPAEFMRALRDFDSGDEFELDIKRKRKDRTLKMVMPKNWNSFIAPTIEKAHRIEITSAFN